MKVDLRFKKNEVKKEKEWLKMLWIEAKVKLAMFEESMKAFVFHHKVDILTDRPVSLLSNVHIPDNW